MIRVRFAPSPTGFLHVGSARTALFNWLFARHEGGKFLLRIEDTDTARSKAEFLEEILDSLRWLGLNWDGEIEYQSKRSAPYQAVAERLLSEGLAKKDGQAVIFPVTPGETIAFDDVVHGRVQFNTLEIKDQVLVKSDGTPTYNFACVVDDSEFGLTHIIRGDDHISNTPKQLLLYRALKLTPPKFVHIPLILGTDRSRLSKRHGATSLREYRKMGFLPEAMVNFLSLLGWAPGGDREILSLSEIVREFTLERIGKTGAMFDLEKLKWMNSQYLKTASLEQLLPLVQEKLQEKGWWPPVRPSTSSPARLLSSPGRAGRTDTGAWMNQVIELYKSRAETVEDLCRQAQGLFTDEIPFDAEAVTLRLKQPGAQERLSKFADRLEPLPDWAAGSIESSCRALAEELKIKPAELIHPARVAVTGRSVGPSLFHLLEVAGRERVISRLRQAATSVCANPS